MTAGSEERPLRVCLDARLDDGEAGGIQQFIVGLAHGLSRISDGDEEYYFWTKPGSEGWIRPHLGGACRELPSRPEVPATSRRRGLGAFVPRALERKLFASELTLRLVRVGIPESDGAVEGAGMDVMHFTVQTGFRTALPSLYQPYDLQHVHFPEFFTPIERKRREAMYGALCRAAALVPVMSSWVKDDVVRHYQLEPDKVRVVPWAPVVRSYPEPSAGDLVRTRERLRLPEAFALYPAHTWGHKNHLRLLEAVAFLRDQAGLRVPVVCSGTKKEFFGVISRRLADLGLVDQVQFPGFVSTLELRALYTLARVLVFPSLFEGGGMPIFEAFSLGVPVASSNATGLPKQAGDAALLFDPRDVPAMADALGRLWQDAGLREELVRRGRARVAPFSWERTARKYRALYRSVAGRELGEEDRALLGEPPPT